MSNLKQFKNRIKTIKSSEKITQAMQMVSASKLQKLKNQLSESGPYLTVLGKMMRDIFESGILSDLSPLEQQYFNDDVTLPELFILITSERGLCGSFNSTIIKKVKADISKVERESGKVKLIIIGKKGYDVLKSKYATHIDSYFNISKLGGDNLFLQIKQRIVHLVSQAQIGRCHIYYNKFKNAIMQIPTRHSILPVHVQYFYFLRDDDLAGSVNTAKLAAKPESKKAHKSSHTSSLMKDNNFEYEGEGFILKVIDLYINGVVNFALLQSRTNEERARMTAMDNATKNAKEIIDKLTLKLNRSRQAIITKELIEIISGAEAAAS